MSEEKNDNKNYIQIVVTYTAIIEDDAIDPDGISSEQFLRDVTNRLNTYPPSETELLYDSLVSHVTDFGNWHVSVGKTYHGKPASIPLSIDTVASIIGLLYK